MNSQRSRQTEADIRELLAEKDLRPKFPTVLDATALSAYKLCPRKFFWSTLYQLVSAQANPHFIAGGAYAKGHEVFRQLYYTGKPKTESLYAGLIALIREYGEYEPDPDGRPSEAAKTWENVALAYLTYYDDYPPESDFIIFAQAPEVGPMVEFSFGIPFKDLRNPETGDPILYGGKFDGIVHYSTQLSWGSAAGDYSKFSSSPLYGYDDKTTHAMGSSWAAQWKMRSQFLGYTWGAYESGFPLKGFIVRGAAIQKTQTKHMSVPLHFASWKIQEWLETTYHTICEIIRDWEEEIWKKDFDTACGSYGGCSYIPLCDSPQPVSWISRYKTRDWSPIEVESL